jgi:hypothetical protein
MASVLRLVCLLYLLVLCCAGVDVFRLTYAR